MAASKDDGKKLGFKVLTHGNCLLCGKRLAKTNGLFLCEKCRVAQAEKEGGEHENSN